MWQCCLAAEYRYVTQSTCFQIMFPDLFPCVLLVFTLFFSLSNLSLSIGPSPGVSFSLPPILLVWLMVPLPIFLLVLLFVFCLSLFCWLQFGSLWLFVVLCGSLGFLTVLGRS